VEATSRGEIAQVGFFARDDLPAELSRGTKRRLDEVFGSLAADPYW
jgi:hypothetical protein